MANQNTIGRHKTAIYNDGEYTKVVYHSTAVVSFNEAKIILNTGGWKSPTTKVRMNQTSNQFALGFYVYQKDFVWFVDYKGHKFEMEGETLELDRHAVYNENAQALKSYIGH